jgi:predicted nucleotidyltransferase
MKKEFWREWKRVSKIEERAIKSVRRAKKILFENIPKDKIVSIYIKGSFVRREMNRKSDVDIVPIVKDNETLRKIVELDKAKRFSYKPAELLPHSLTEFEKDKRAIKRKALKAKPNVFLSDLYNHKLIYGSKLDVSKFKQVDARKRFKDFLKAFDSRFIPAHKEGKFGFSELLKQVFWLVELEMKIKGENPPHPWKKLEKFVKDKRHIVHDTLKLRLNPTKDKRIRKNYLAKLEKYLKSLQNI